MTVPLEELIKLYLEKVDNLVDFERHAICRGLELLYRSYVFNLKPHFFHSNDSIESLLESERTKKEKKK